MSVTLSAQEITELPTAKGLQALIDEKEKNPSSSARLIILSPEIQSGERWIYQGKQGDKHQFRKVLFNTGNLVNK